MRQASVAGSLFEVPEKLITSYNRALEAAVGKRTSLTTFAIDRRGWSEQIAEELGVDYLDPSPSDRYVIVVSPEQRRAPMLRHDFSFDAAMLDAVFADHRRTIDIATRVDGLWGEIDDHVRVLASIEDVIAVRHVDLELRAPSRFIERSLELEECIAHLRAAPDLLVADDSALVRRIAELALIVGDVRDRGIQRVHASAEVASFHTRLFGGIWVLRDVPSLGTTRAVGTRRRHSIVIHGDEMARAAPAAQFVALSDADRVVDVLLQSAVVRYEPTLVDVRLHQVEDEALAEAGYDQERPSKGERNRALAQIRDRMPAVWKSLLDVQREIELGHPFAAAMARATAPVRAAMLQPIESRGATSEVVASLLTRLWPHDYAATHRVDHQELNRIIERSPDWKRAHIGRCVAAAER